MAIELPMFTDRAHKMREYSNWLTISKVIYATKDIGLVLRILHLELTTNKRPMIIKRLYSRFSHIRSEIERMDIDLFLKDAKDDIQSSNLWRSWVTLAGLVREADLDVIKSMILHERRNKNRSHILKRMYGHYAMKRMAAEQEDIKRWLRNGYGV